jgi:serine phosphatase RsbU (regulator of sigma subunit)
MEDKQLKEIVDGIVKRYKQSEASGESKGSRKVDLATALQLCEAVKADVDLFAGEAEQFDDITMVCVAYHGPQQDNAEEVS